LTFSDKGKWWKYAGGGHAYLERRRGTWQDGEAELKTLRVAKMKTTEGLFVFYHRKGEIDLAAFA